MKRKIVNRLSKILLLLPLLFAGCTGEKTPGQVEEESRRERIFDTQRSALEQAKMKYEKVMVS